MSNLIWLVILPHTYQAYNQLSSAKEFAELKVAEGLDVNRDKLYELGWRWVKPEPSGMYSATRFFVNVQRPALTVELRHINYRNLLGRV